MDERFLYHIWDAGHLKSDLQTVSGKSLQVVYQGQFNTNRGPDFVNAILRLDGDELQGSVEIHLGTQDWQRHNHQEDMYFNPVVLHVVYVHNSPMAGTIKENGELVEILELQHQLSEDIDKLVGSYGDTPFQQGGDYCDLLSAIDKDRLHAILITNGKQRFLGKVRRNNAALSLSSFDQIIYEGIMEAAGYDKNKLNLLQLAQQIPFTDIQAWLKEGLDGTGLASIFCISSGLLTKSKNRFDDKLEKALQRTYELQTFFARRIPIDWQLFRIRPANHPLPRLILLSEFIAAGGEKSIWGRFLHSVETGDPDNVLHFQRFSKLLADITSPLLATGTKLGATVIRNIYYNIYLPILYLYAQKMADLQRQETIEEAWIHFKALPDNYITRFMYRYINPGQIRSVSTRAVYQQGLINLYYNYCRYHLCTQCSQKI